MIIPGCLFVHIFGSHSFPCYEVATTVFNDTDIIIKIRCSELVCITESDLCVSDDYSNDSAGSIVITLSIQ